MTSNSPRTYTLDAEKLKLNAYRLLCLFYANTEIARTSDPEEPTDAATSLERQFFAREMTELLLSIAIGIRVLDDQMLSLEPTNDLRVSYLAKKEQVNKARHCMMFDEMPLREVCNKIIHAVVVEPHSTEGTGSHQIDKYNWQGYSEAKDQSPDEEWAEPEPVKWNHLSGNIRLGGSRKKEQWWLLLMVPEFVEAVYGLVN
ncbi:hypothetical protein [Candidatus Nitrotoga arctica]|uniref:McrBC 5-methylcytosine restriction system component n=1 Tax=Candidatus Nitrotoga arctica TaxID=453162 RepID=A0ABN8AMH2_9PROT|nr:hypothetical protein [Candidatus Nitrotoga arctica]CAG9933968.1 conserved protein of unknown function [Candidatus Nitrotoga arctica]